MSFPKYVNSPVAHHDPIEDAKKYFDHVESLFYASEKSKKVQRLVTSWSVIFWFVTIIVIVFNFDIVASLLKANWNYFETLGPDGKENIGFLIMLIFITVAILLHRLLKWKLKRTYGQRVVSDEITAFCYIFLARKKLIEFSFNSNSEYLDNAESYFHQFINELFCSHKVNDNKELMVSLEEIDGYIGEYKWLQLDNDSRNLLNTIISFQKIFPKAVEKRKHLEELTRAVEWLVLYAKAISIAGRNSLSNTEIQAVLMPIAESVKKMEDLIEPSEMTPESLGWRQSVAGWFKKKHQHNQTFRIVYYLLVSLLIIGTIAAGLIFIFGKEHQTVIIGILAIAAGMVALFMKREKQ